VLIKLMHRYAARRGAPAASTHRTGLQGFSRRAPARLNQPAFFMASQPDRKTGRQRHADGKLRCAWCRPTRCTLLYHDTEWEYPFTMTAALPKCSSLSSEGAQAG